MKKITKILSLTLATFVLTSVAMANEIEVASLPKEGDTSLTISATYLNKIRKDTVGVPGNLGLTKKNGLGMGIEANYFLEENVSLSAMVSFQRFAAQANPLTLGATLPSDGAKPVGASVKYIPLRLGVNFHMNNFGVIRPFVGGGYEYAFSSYKSNLGVSSNPANPSSTKLKKAGKHGAYVQAGFNFLVDENVDMQLKVLKSLNTRTGNYVFAIGNTGPVPKSVKASPLEVSLGFTIKLDR